MLYDATIRFPDGGLVRESTDRDELRELAGILTAIADGNTHYQLKGPDGRHATVGDIAEVMLRVIQ